MAKFLSGFFILLLLFISTEKFVAGSHVAHQCPAYFKKMRKYEGKIDSAENMRVIYAFPLGESGSSPYDLVTTEMVMPGEKREEGRPRLHYIRNLGNGRFVEDKSFPLILTEHAREIIPIRLHDKKAFVVADHGFDWPPYLGGQPRIVLNEKGQWKDETKKRFPDIKKFNFNVSSLSLNQDGNVDLFFNVVNSEKGVSFFLKNDGRAYFHLSDKIPNELIEPSTCYMTSRFWGSEAGSDYIFLGGCDRSAEAHKTPQDRILRVQNKVMSLLRPEQVSPRFKDPSWGTVDIQVADINKDGARDVVTAVHNSGFTVGGIQFYLKNPKAMSFQTPRDGYIQVTDEATPSFVPFVRLGDLDGDGYPEVIAPITPVDNGAHPLKKFFVLYENAHGNGFEDVSSCLNSSLHSIVHADIVDLNHDGKSDIFLLSYDGAYEIYYSQ